MLAIYRATQPIVSDACMILAAQIIGQPTLSFTIIICGFGSAWVGNGSLDEKNWMDQSWQDIQASYMAKQNPYHFDVTSIHMKWQFL